MFRIKKKNNKNINLKIEWEVVKKVKLFAPGKVYRLYL